MKLDLQRARTAKECATYDQKLGKAVNARKFKIFSIIENLEPPYLCLMCADQFCKLRRYLVLRWASIASLYALEHPQEEPSGLKTKKSIKNSFTVTPIRTPMGLDKQTRFFKKINFLQRRFLW